MNLKLHTPQPPAGLLSALERARLNYSTAKTLFHLVWLGDEFYCGVFGDGDNGAYEWFTWNAGKLEHSDAGYGGTDCALRDVLNKAIPA